MAAVVTAKAPSVATKMKKPSLPTVQTANSTSRQSAPSSSPSSSVKRLPGQTTPQSVTNPAPSNQALVTNNTARPNRRLQRLSTRTGTIEPVTLDKKAAAKKFAAPHVSKELFVLKKFKGRPPSLIVHLHPTHFRFDQQDGSFGYQSEMRVFIEHLQKRTIPHDMLEEFRKSDVQFYDGWLIVRIIDHKAAAAHSTSTSGQSDDAKPFSIHNHNNFITPSPYAPHTPKESNAGASPAVKLERQGSTGKENVHSDLPSDDTIDVLPKTSKPQPKVYHVALRPTQLSLHTDIALDAMAPDPKTLNRKQSNQLNSRTPASGQPPTPIGAIPSTPTTEKPPPLKRQKLKIDPKDLLEYEGRIVNAIAPPLYLKPVENLDEAEQILSLLKDPWHDEAPPLPKSRKRTVAELAADDAHAKEQERFMLIMDERGVGNSNLANTGGVDGQTGTASFQPRFERFNVLDQIKRELEEKKQREKERQLQEDEARRGHQQEEERRRLLQMQQATERRRQVQAQAQAQALQQQQQQQQQQQASQQQAQSQAAAMAGAKRQQAQPDSQAAAVQGQSPAQQQNTRRPPGNNIQAGQPVRPPTATAQAQQVPQASQARPAVNRMPPQVQSQMTPVQASSPVVRQGTPQNTSSPVVGSRQMVGSQSQQGAAGSPARPGSALQHAHPAAAMARGPSAQGPSRNGTPQLAHETPNMRNVSTPVLRQGTPSQHMAHQSPRGSMPAPTPQMGHAGMVGPSPQMVNGVPAQVARMPMNPQMVEMQRRQQLIQQQMVNGNQQQQQQMQMAYLRAQQQAMQQGTPQAHHGSPNTSQAYSSQLGEVMKNQMQSLQQGQNRGSPAPNQMSPAQMQHFQQMQQLQQIQQARVSQQQQQQQQQQQAQSQQQGDQMNPMSQQQMSAATQQRYQNLVKQCIEQLRNDAANNKYGGNPQLISPQEQQQIQRMAQHRAQMFMQQQMQQRVQMMQQQQQQQQQNGGSMMQNAGMGQMNAQMAAQLHQQQEAQRMQAIRMQQAQHQLMAQQAQQAQGNVHNPFQHMQDMQNMQNMMGGQQR